MWNGMNKRSFPRADYPCKIKVRQKGASDAIVTRTENIGCGGVCVILNKNLGLFKEVELEINLENGLQLVKCDGRIVWVVKRESVGGLKPPVFDTGIEFVNLKDEYKDRIDKIIQKVLKDNV